MYPYTHKGRKTHKMQITKKYSSLKYCIKNLKKLCVNLKKITFELKETR